MRKRRCVYLNPNGAVTSVDFELPKDANVTFEDGRLTVIHWDEHANAASVIRAYSRVICFEPVDEPVDEPLDYSQIGQPL